MPHPVSPPNQPIQEPEIDRLKRLTFAARQLDQDMEILDREAQRLHVDVQKFIDKKKLLDILQHISEH